MSKNPEEAMNFLSYVAEVSRRWDEPNAREVGRMNSQPNASNAKARMYTLNKGTDTKANLQLWQEEEWRNLKCRPFQTHQCKLSRVQFVNLLSTWWKSVLQCQL
ncbi:hypothetical protein CK203_019770 [Vitis vinifera]|uniref:Uncharacterized protein n=1 Tax=Vitis vinifera TaxID=29760 RepID=A0A438JQM0_VITVI|nr:hypothetical protein CK203_019770 [Vitis vinifera]